MAMACLLLLATLISASLASKDPSQVLVPGLSVSYQGTRTGSIEHFLNIKYAHADRFAPPQPFIPPSGSNIEATLAGPSCPQIKEAMPPAFFETGEMSEDCLHLRIARPPGLNASSQVPVVVWIHGGGVVKGSAYDAHFDPDRLLDLSMADGTPIIWVALNYRLGIFGFPTLPELKERKSMDLGLRDQRLGLEWVRDHIGAFGGDPDKVTVYGLSSGGTLSSLQLMAFGGEKEPLFQQLWAMSGPPGTALNMSTDGGLLHTKAVAESMGCDDEETLRCLRDVPMQDLLDQSMEYAQKNHAPHGIFTFIPTVDGDFFPDRPTELVRMGRFAKGIRLIFGWTQDDGAMNALPAQAIQTEEEIKEPVRKYARLLTDAEFDTLFSLYSTENFEPKLHNYNARKTSNDPEVTVHFFRASRILRDILFTCPSIKFGFEMMKQSRALDPTFDSVRLYDLNQTVYGPLLGAIGMPFVGACHGSDQVYMFNGVFPEGDMSLEHQGFAQNMARSLISFAYTGDPGKGWPSSFQTTREGDVLPDEFAVQVLGGPYGNGSVEVGSSKKGDMGYFPGAGQYLNSLQEVFPGFGRMSSKASAERQRLIEGEKLHERCLYANELSESLGI